jgi:hypothetical protein
MNVFGPPPRPLDIPPFKIDGTKLVLGEEGPEYKKISRNSVREDLWHTLQKLQAYVIGLISV